MANAAQTIVTMIAPLRAGAEPAVRARLESFGYVGLDPDNDLLGFADVEMLHFASLFLYDDPEVGWSLVFESNIDGEVEAYLDRLLAVARGKDSGSCLLGLFGNCRDFSPADLPTLKRYLLERVHLPVAGYVAGVGLTRDRIRKDAAIHGVVDRVLNGGTPAMTAPQALQQVLTALRADPATTHALDMSGDSGRGPTLLGKVIEFSTLIATAIPFAALGVLNLGKERTAPEDRSRQQADQVLEQKRFEDHAPTNHMASIAYLHTDWSRQWAKRTAYMLLSCLVKLKYFRGELGGIKTIHFAHWAMLNGGRRLLFVSNFDGSWDSYLDDFTLKAATGLTLAWAHCVGFPTSRFMLGGGAAKGPEFIDWARRTMVPCPVWYNAYPGVSVAHVVRNRRLREELIAATAGGATSTWLEYV